MAGELMDFDPTKIDIYLDPTNARIYGLTRHGNLEFEAPYLSHIVDNLWVGGCANTLVLPENIKHLVSMYKWEQYTVNHELESSLTIEMYDSDDEPVFEQVRDIAKHVNYCLETGPVALHCQAGLNRSNLVATAALVLQGYSVDDAISLLRKKRSPAVLCNRTFEEWLRDNEQRFVDART